MGKNIVVIASGLTEKEAIRPLTREFCSTEGAAIEVRIPRGGNALMPSVIEKLARAAWWEMKLKNCPPDKFVVLVDADGRSESEREAPLKAACESLKDLPVTFLVTSAQWHLEAWFFGDPEALRSFLHRDLGAIDPTRPDEITNPKLHLKHLLGAPYTARIAGEIAAFVKPISIATRSPSFHKFLNCLKNGGDSAMTAGHEAR
ncbi:MAG: DUF4276 family protein [Candidatus Binataceae bacterium]